MNALMMNQQWRRKQMALILNTSLLWGINVGCFIRVFAISNLSFFPFCICRSAQAGAGRQGAGLFISHQHYTYMVHGTVPPW